MRAEEIILRPLITEKTQRLIAENNEYLFAVALKAKKSSIKKAIEDIFKVKVLKVRTLNLPGKIKRVGKLRKEKKFSGFKKAIVKLKEGEKISLFETEGEKK